MHRRTFSLNPWGNLRAHHLRASPLLLHALEISSLHSLLAFHKKLAQMTKEEAEASVEVRLRPFPLTSPQLLSSCVLTNRPYMQEVEDDDDDIDDSEDSDGPDLEDGEQRSVGWTEQRMQLLASGCHRPADPLLLEAYLSASQVYQLAGRYGGSRPARSMCLRLPQCTGSLASTGATGDVFNLPEELQACSAAAKPQGQLVFRLHRTVHSLCEPRDVTTG